MQRDKARGVQIAIPLRSILWQFGLHVLCPCWRRYTKNMNVTYLQLIPGVEPPHLNCEKPFRAVVVVEDIVQEDWQHAVSHWLVLSECLYMLAWGIECSSWDDSVDFAILEKHDFNEIPDEQFVMTTWHEKESLEDVFTFSKYGAFHSDAELVHTLILHVCSTNKESEFLSSYDSV